MEHTFFREKKVNSHASMLLGHSDTKMCSLSSTVDKTNEMVNTISNKLSHEVHVIKEALDKFNNHPGY